MVLPGCAATIYVSNFFRSYQITIEIQIFEKELNFTLDKDMGITDKFKK